jgi:hypothetical protein
VVSSDITHEIIISSVIKPEVVVCPSANEWGIMNTRLMCNTFPEYLVSAERSPVHSHHNLVLVSTDTLIKRISPGGPMQEGGGADYPGYPSIHPEPQLLEEDWNLVIHPSGFS